MFKVIFVMVSIALMRKICHILSSVAILILYFLMTDFVKHRESLVEVLKKLIWVYVLVGVIHFIYTYAHNYEFYLFIFIHMDMAYDD